MITDSDITFLNYCEELSKTSQCHSRKIGAIIVKEDVIIGHGVNGPLAHLPDCVELYDKLSGIQSNFAPHCPRKRIGYKSGEYMNACQAAHAERVAINNALKLKHDTNDATLYMNSCIPCKDCMLAIVMAGITRVVIDELVIYGESFLSPYIAHESGIIVQSRDGKTITDINPDNYR